MYKEREQFIGPTPRRREAPGGGAWLGRKHNKLSHNWYTQVTEPGHFFNRWGPIVQRGLSEFLWEERKRDAAVAPGSVGKGE